MSVAKKEKIYLAQTARPSKKILKLLKRPLKTLIRLYQTTKDKDYWEAIYFRFERSICNAINKYGGVSSVDFKKHDLYGELCMAVRQAVINYNLKGTVEFNTYLNSTFKIYIHRYFSTVGNRSLSSPVIIQDPETNLIADEVDFTAFYYTSPDYEPDSMECMLTTEEREKEEKEKYLRLFECEELDEKLGREYGMIEGFLYKLNGGIDCKKPYKLLEISKILPDYSRYRERIRAFLDKYEVKKPEAAA